jgi:hypothetical protein
MGFIGGTDFAAAWWPQNRCRFDESNGFYKGISAGGRKIGAARRPQFRCRF